MNGSAVDGRGRLVSALVVCAFVAAYFVIGLVTLDETTRFVPVLAAGITLLLVVADIVKLLLGRSAADGAVAEGGGVAIDGVTPRREFAAIGLVAAATAGVFYAGFHIAIPLYLFVSVAWLGRLPVRNAFLVAIGTSLAIYVVFELALAYSLHRGIFFQ